MVMRTCGAILVAGLMLAVSPAQAQEETANLPASKPSLAADTVDNPLDSGSSVVRDSAVVQAVLAANPGREMVICLAGCKSGHGSILWHRPRLVETVDGAGGVGSTGASANPVAAPAASSATVETATLGSQPDAVVCVAGCNGPVGVVVWRNMRFAWVRDEHKENLAAALRRIGDRLAAQNEVAPTVKEPPVPNTRVWVGAAARDGLQAAFGGPVAPPARFAGVKASPRS